jgi:hypothetical protein
MEAMRAYDVMTEERVAPIIRLAPMPQPVRKRRTARKPMKLAKMTMPMTKITPKPVEEEEEKYDLYESLDRAFAQVRLMIDGKLPKKSIDELIEELRVEEQKLALEDELRNNHN